MLHILYCLLNICCALNTLCATHSVRVCATCSVSYNSYIYIYCLFLVATWSYIFSRIYIYIPVCYVYVISIYTYIWHCVCAIYFCVLYTCIVRYARCFSSILNIGTLSQILLIFKVYGVTSLVVFI